MAARHERKFLRLLRQHFPKGTDLSLDGVDDLAALAATLNARPRKVLQWRTPTRSLSKYYTSFMLLLRRPLESTQYASRVYVDRLRSMGVTRSMSRKANPYDNARMESLFKTL